MKRSFVPTLIVALAAAFLALLAPGLALAAVGISVSPSSIDFGQVVIGQSSIRQVEVFSTGTDPLEVNQVQFSLDNVQVWPSYPGLLVGGLGRIFFMDTNYNNATISIPAGESRFISFTFTPSSAGFVSGTLFIDGNFGGALPAVSYTGEGLWATSPYANGRASVPTTLNFGDIVLGQTATANLVVGNTGTGDLWIVYLEFTGGSGFTNMSVTGTTWTFGVPFGLEIILPASQSATIPIQLTPVALGPINGSLLLYISDSVGPWNTTTITFAGNVITQPAPVAAAPSPPPPPPEIPGISFFYESTVKGDSVEVGLFLKWKVIWLDDSSVVWNLGNSRTAKGVNVRVMMPLGVDTVSVAAKDIRDDSTHVYSEVLTFTQPAAVVIAPTVPAAEPTTPVFTTGLIGSSLAKSEGLAGGGGKKRPKSQVVTAPPVAKLVAGAGVQGASWGAIKNLQE